MAEAIALGASVIAIVQVADRIIGLCKFYIETARDAPSDLRNIFIETSALKNTLESLYYLEKHDGANSTVAKNICGPNGPIDGCNQTLAALEKLFPDGVLRPTGRRKNEKTKKINLDAIMASLAWPLKETKARKLLDELVRYKTTINLALTTGVAQDVRCIKEETSRIYEMLTASQSREVYTWLEHTDPSSLHQRASKNYEPETGTWIWKSPEWIDWIACKHRAIHVHGIPGAGKTVLMSYLIGQIEKHCNQDANVNRVYVYYYCYFAHKQDETRPFLKWLIGRLCWKAGGVPLFVSNLRSHGAEPSLEDLLEAVAQLLSFFETVFVAIDAVDESQTYNELLNILHILATDRKFQRLQIVTSGRQYRDIEQVMRSISQLISMSNPFVEQDIRRYVHSTLQRSPYFHKWPQDLLNEVEESLAKGASGMFRWAVCQIDIIRRLKYERTVIQNTLKTLPKTLYETYDRIVQIVPEEDRMFVYYTLQWIAFRNEINIGNAVPYRALIGAAEASIFRLTGSPNMRLYDRDELADVCGCLINIGSPKAFTDYVDSARIGELNDGVTFAHYSVQEYLDSKLDLSSLFGRHTLRGAGLKSHLLETAFIEAQLLDKDELSNVLSALSQESSSLDLTLATWSSCLDFRIYGLILASTSLYKFFEHIFCNDSLKTLALDLLDPSRPHSATMEELMNHLDPYMLEAELGPYYFGEHFPWRFLWDPKTEDDVKRLGNLLFLAQDDLGRFSPAENFLDTKDHNSLLQAQMSFSKSIHIELPDYSGEQFEFIFKGSFIEVFAQLGCSLSNTFEFLMEISAGLFDPSIVLAQYLGGANTAPERDDSSHPVQRLLELGADPNLQGYKITALQIAALSGDNVGLKVLLRAGAQPNDTGTPNGVTWEDDCLMSRVALIHGASPLRICRRIRSLGDALGYDPSRGEREKMEESLLSYGAEDFVLPSCTLDFGDETEWCSVFEMQRST